MDFLGLPNLRTLSVIETEHDFQVLAVILSGPVGCPSCGASSSLMKRNGWRKKLVLDSPVRGKRVRILLFRKRFKCSECGKTSKQPFVELDERRSATKRLVEYTGRQALRKTFATVGEEVGWSCKTVRSIFTDFVELLSKSVCFETPTCIGIDEVYIGRVARCIITDNINRRVIGLLHKKDMLSLTRYLVQLPHKERIKQVTTDMYRPFYTVVKRVLPHAEIVVDTYHVQRMANQAVNAVLQRVRAGLDRSERRDHMRDRFLLFRRNYDLPEDKKEIIKIWGQNLPQIGIAYQLKEEFLDLWKLSRRDEAERRYEEWRGRIPGDLSYAFKEITTAITNWHREVFNYFDFKVTNAFTESANNIIKSLQRQGRSYSFEVIRAKMLYGGGFITKRPAYNSREWEMNVGSEGKRKKQRNRADAPNSLDSYVRRLKRLRESQDVFNQLLQPPDVWKARFTHIISLEKAHDLPD